MKKLAYEKEFLKLLSKAAVMIVLAVLTGFNYYSFDEPLNDDFTNIPLKSTITGVQPMK